MSPEVFRIIAGGGLGDVLLVTPALRSLRTAHPGARINVLCFLQQHKDILEGNPCIDRLSLISFKSTPIEWLKIQRLFLKRPGPIPGHRHGSSGYLTMVYGQYSPNLFPMGHGAEIIGEMFGVPVTNLKLEVFLTKKEEAEAKALLSQYRRPIVIQVTGGTTPNKNWKIERWHELVRRNPEYTFIQVGAAGEEKVEGAVDLRGITSIRKSLAILKHVAAFIGVESFLAHATNAVDIPGVVLCGPSSPHVSYHPNTIVLFGHQRCSPCLDILGNGACVYERACMSSISVEQVESALKRALSWNGRGDDFTLRSGVEEISSPTAAEMHPELSLAEKLVVQIRDCERRLALIDDAMAAELGKPLLRRHRGVLFFLYKEKAVYEGALAMLRGIGKDAVPELMTATACHDLGGTS